MSYEESMLIMPFHPAETGPHLRAFNLLGLKVIAYGGLINIIITVLVSNFTVVERFLKVAEIMSGSAALRLRDLLSENHISAAAYVSGILTSLPIAAISGWLIYRNYKSKILNRRDYRIFHWGYTVGVIFALTLAIFAVNFQFLFEVDFSSRFRSTFVYIFLFPLFCFFSALCNFITAALVINMVVFVVKFRMKEQYK